MDPRYMDSGSSHMHSGIQQMQNIGAGEQYQTRGLYDIIKLLSLANPKLNKKDLLLYMLQRNLDQGNNEDAFGKAFYQNQKEMGTRRDLGIPSTMPFTPGSTWM